MANSDKYQITTDWATIKANGADIMNGTFTIFNLLQVKVDFIISDGAPNDQAGDFYMSDASDSIRVTLQGAEMLYARVARDTTMVGVVSS